MRLIALCFSVLCKLLHNIPFFNGYYLVFIT